MRRLVHRERMAGDLDDRPELEPGHAVERGLVERRHAKPQTGERVAHRAHDLVHRVLVGDRLERRAGLDLVEDRRGGEADRWHVPRMAAC